MNKRLLIRSVALLLVAALSITAFPLRAEAKLTDICFPGDLDGTNYMINPVEYGGDTRPNASNTLILRTDNPDPVPDSQPIDYEYTMGKDLYQDEEGKWGSVPVYTGTALAPYAVDNRMDLYFAKTDKQLNDIYNSGTSRLGLRIEKAEQAVSNAQKDFNYYKKVNDKLLEMKMSRMPKNGKAPTKLNAGINKCKNFKNPATETLTKSKAALNQSGTRLDKFKEFWKTKIWKNNFLKGTFKVGMAALTIYFAGLAIADLIENPENGYKSPFFESLTKGLRGGSAGFALVSVISPKLAVVALVLGFGEMIMTSDTVKQTLNKHLPNVPVLDALTELKNSTETLFWLMYFDWKYGADEKAQAQDVAKNIHLANKLGTASISGVLPVGVFDIVRGATACANGINAYKPNIYLYPEEPTEMTVTFGHPTALTVTDPAYPREGWKVTAWPDGTLWDGSDTYGYLFYEAVTSDRYYQTEAGYVIPAEAREETFTKILEAYGLNQTEIREFNEYWCVKLEPGVDYAMYPQLTETIDAAMPMTVTPEPDSVLRIWFAFVPNGEPTVTPEPEPFQRAGTAVLEWGGFFLGE